MLDRSLERLEAAPDERRALRLLHELEDVLTPTEFAALGAHLERPELRALHAGLSSARAIAAGTPQSYGRRVIADNVLHFSDDRLPAADKTLVVAFAGRMQRLMIPNVAFLQCLPASRYDVVIVSDPARQHFRRGLPGYADGFLALVGALGRDVPHGDYRRSVSFGASMGGLPAVWYGIMADTERTICIGARRAWDIDRLLSGDAPPHAYEPLCACCGGGRRNIVFVHAAGHAADSEAARNHAGLVGGQVLAIPGLASHNPLADLWHSGAAGPMLDRLFRAKVFQASWKVHRATEAAQPERGSRSKLR